MKKRHKVIWSNVAEHDLKNIIDYITIDSPSAALRIFNNIKQKASNLYFFPEKGRIVPELKDQGILQYRELIISPWRLIYRVSEKQAYVLSILDSRQNIEDILLNRFIKS